ncbi:MAG TPA: hypothetical protein PLL05_01175 [Muribaculaceae bacterium]|nr:hypothetical protein [Muribaculaceae bacterium]
MRKTRLLLLWAFLLGAIQLNAQYTFTVTMHGRGSKECADAAAMANSIMEKYNSASFPTKAQCEQARSMLPSIRIGTGWCTFSFTTSPCTGTEISSFGSNSTSKISGMPSQNAGVAIRNEMQDYAYQQSIQNGINAANSVIVPGTSDYNASVNKIIANDISSGNNAQVVLKRMIPNLNDRISETANLLLDLYKQGKRSTDLFSRMLSDQFKALTGFDIYELNNKIKPTPEEQEILNSYNEYVDMVCKSAQDKLSDEEERVPELEMAAYSIAVYKKDDDTKLFTDYFKLSPLRDMSLIRNPQERSGAEKIVNFINENEGKSGFNSEIYYDKTQDKYVIAIRGTELGWSKEAIKDVGVDLAFALLTKSPQHDIAYKLAQTIKESGIPLDKIKITGHSLGGGLASIVGLITGCETYVYNPAHVSLGAAEHYKLDLSRQDNIHTYTAAPKELVRGLETAASSTAANIAFVARVAKECGLAKEKLESVIIASGTNTAYLNLGSQEAIETGEDSRFAHSMTPMYSAIRTKDSSKKWMENRDAYKFMSNMRASGELSFKASSLNLIKVPSELQGLKISYRSKK